MTTHIDLCDASALWAAAARRLLTGSKLDMDDVLDVIGPVEDPAIAECIGVVAETRAPAGCVVCDFRVDETARY